MSFPAKWHILSLFLMPVVQCIVVQWRHISSESAVQFPINCVNIWQQNVYYQCWYCSKCDAQLKAWDILLVLTSVAGNLCNKCPSGYSNKTAVKVILSMWSLVSIEQQSPRRPCDTMGHQKLSTTFLTLSWRVKAYLLLRYCIQIQSIGIA